MHPKYIDASAEIEGLRAKFRQVLSAAVGILGNSCKSSKDYEDGLAKGVEQQEAKAMDLDRKAVNYSMLKRDAEADKAMYDAMITRMTELDVTGDPDSCPIKIVETAVVPDKPAGPNPVLYMLASAMLGLALGVGAVIVLMRSNAAITTVAHVDRFIGLPVLSLVPQWKPSDGKLDLNFFDSPNHAFSEAFRSLRASMLLQDKNKEPQTFLIASATPGEGKTMISCNLGVAFANSGMKTLLIDVDLRKPMVSRRIFGKEERPGIVEFLKGKATFDEIVRPTGIENYYVITAGKHVSNPAELLRKNVLQPLIATAMKSFEKIIIDSPPVLPVSDALILAGDVQTVCFTVRSGKTHWMAVKKACDALAEAGKEPAGIILNGIQERHHAQHYYYYGNYGKGYGETVKTES
jgi:capsular exopolysaccharide synthesis family protein